MIWVGHLQYWIEVKGQGSNVFLNGGMDMLKVGKSSKQFTAQSYKFLRMWWLNRRFCCEYEKFNIFVNKTVSHSRGCTPKEYILFLIKSELFWAFYFYFFALKLCSKIKFLIFFKIYEKKTLVCRFLPFLKLNVVKSMILLQVCSDLLITVWDKATDFLNQQTYCTLCYCTNTETQIFFVIVQKYPRNCDHLSGNTHIWFLSWQGNAIKGFAGLKDPKFGITIHGVHGRRIHDLNKCLTCFCGNIETGHIYSHSCCDTGEWCSRGDYLIPHLLSEDKWAAVSHICLFMFLSQIVLLLIPLSDDTFARLTW